MKLEALLTYRATLKPGVEVGAMPGGTRTIFEVTGGDFEGAKLRGKLLTGGGDWLIIDDQGAGHLDVRATFETDDGAHLYVQYNGILVVNDKVTTALAGGADTQFGDTYFFNTPRFETGDERYAWLNRIVTVGEGRVLSGAVEYRVFQVLPD